MGNYMSENLMLWKNQTPNITEYDLHIHQGLLFLLVVDNSKF